ncbi:MAG TPA: MFS transporter [Candidatus Limnocylindria bacterium]|nr:MFS transporter [Candidatus Limnocylindria bacterium]
MGCVTMAGMNHASPAVGPGPSAWETQSAAGRLAFAMVLAVAMATGTFAGYAFGVLGPLILDEFDLSRFELGLLTTFFFVIGGPLSLAAGRATDRYGARVVMLVAFAAVSVALVVMAAAPIYPVMLGGAALAGIALATGNPVTNKLVAVHLPPGRRGLVMGGKQAGVQVGAFLAGAVLAPVAALVGWRLALGWSAAVPLLGLLAALLVVPATTGAARREAVDAARTAAMPAGVWRLALYAFLMGGGVAAVNAYLPLYLVERGGASHELAGAVAATIGAVGIGSRIAWGWASERMPSYRIPLVSLAAGAVLAVLLLLGVAGIGLWVAWPAAALFGATAVSWNSVGMLAVITASGSGLAGRASGIVVFGFYVGFVGMPLLFGWLVDSLNDYALAWLLVAGLFATAAGVVASVSTMSRGSDPA